MEVKGDLYFNKTIFWDPVYFSYTKFSGDAHFNRTTFEEYADFDHTIFKEYADLSYATFKKNANFGQTVFEQHANFYKATFKDADFRNATFKGPFVLTGTGYNKLSVRWDNIKDRLVYEESVYPMFIKILET